MVVLSIATRKIHPRIGLTYKVSKLSYRVYSAHTWLGKLELLFSYILGLFNGRLALVYAGIRWIWKKQEKDAWTKRVESYINEFLPDAKRLSFDALMAAATANSNICTQHDAYKKAASLYLAESYRRHVLSSTDLYCSTRLLTPDSEFDARTCLKDFFGSPDMIQIVKLVRSRGSSVTDDGVWELEVVPLVTDILRESDGRLVRDVLDLVVL